MAQKREKNSERTKLDILNAAENQFAEVGFFGARIDVIAKLANINKRMIYEYFESKENLYKKVLFNVYKRIETAEDKLLQNKPEGVELIKQTIGMYFDFLQNNPNFVSILMWENLNKANYLKELTKEEVQRKTIPILAKLIKKAKNEGIFKETIDEQQLVVSLITISYANFSNRYTLSRLFDLDLCDEKVVEQRKNHTIEIILAYALK